MRSVSAALLVLCAAGAAFPWAGRLAAQERQAPISADLVLGLWPGYSSDPAWGPRLLTAALPDGFPRAVLPPRSTVLGGLADPFGRSTVVAALPEPAAAAERLLEQQLQAGGWVRHDDNFPSRSGFAVSLPPASERIDNLPAAMPARQLTLASAEFCRDSAVIRARSLPSSTEPGTTLLRLEFNGSRGEYACGGRRGTGLELPPLTPPAGVRFHSSGQSGGGSAVSAHVHMTTTLPPTQLLAHFAAELQRAGWSIGEPQAVGELFTQQVSVQSADGQQWKGLLSVAALAGPNERAAMLHVMRPDERRSDCPQ